MPDNLVVPGVSQVSITLDPVLVLPVVSGHLGLLDPLLVPPLLLVSVSDQYPAGKVLSVLSSPFFSV